MKKNSKAIWEYIKENKENVVFAVYLALTFFFLVLHQNFRDEAQAWLLATYCDFGELVSQMKYEGHFLLWYLILFPFAKLGFPYCTINVISWVLTATATYLMLHKAPFSFFKKTMLLFSFPFLYAYSIIARCYSLLPLTLVLICICYKNRIQHPFLYGSLLIVLFNIHITICIFPFLLILDYIMQLHKKWKELNANEKRQQIFAFFLLVVFIFASIYPLLKCLSTSNEIKSFDLSFFTLISIFFETPPHYLFAITTFVIPNNNIYSNFLFYIGILLISYLFLYYLFRFKRKIFYWFYLCFLYQSTILVCIYHFNTLAKTSLLFLLLPICWIIAINKKEYTKQTSRVENISDKFFVGLWGLHNIATILCFLTVPLLFPYSYTKETADYINQKIPNNSIICVSGEVAKSTALIPYINKDKNIQFYHIPTEHFYNYSVWNAENRYILNQNNIYHIKKLPQVDLFYLYSEVGFQSQEYVNDNDLHNAFIYELEDKKIFQLLIDKDDVQLADEGFKLYKINKDKLNEIYK